MKIVSFICAVLMAFSLTACAQKHLKSLDKGLA